MALLRRGGRGSAGGSNDGDGSDEELAIVLRALVDPRAFAPLYERYYGPILRFCTRRLGSLEAAEDATGEVFKRALHGLAGFHGGSFRAWLFTIADRTLIDLGRKDRPVDPIDDDSPIPDPAPDPETAAIAAAEAERLRAAIAQLPEEWRRVVELRLDGLRNVEIAPELGRTPEWVRQVHSRALKELARILGWPTPENGGAR